MGVRSTKQSLIEQAQAALDASEVARHAGDHRAGADHAQCALELAKKAGQQRLLAPALSLLALHHWRLGDSETAIGDALQALPLVKRDRDAAQRARLLCTLVMAYVDVGLHRDALSHASKAIEAARICADPSLMSWALNRVGVTYEHLDDLLQAERFGLEALEIARGLEGTEERFSALNNLSSMMVAWERKSPGSKTARQHLLRGVGFGTEALALARASGNTHRIAIAEGNLGLAYLHLGEYEQAQHHIDLCGRMAEEHEYRGLALSVVCDRAALARHRGLFREAIALYEDALSQAHHVDDHNLVIDIYMGLYQCHKALGDTARALEYHEAVLPLERERMKQRADTHARLLQHRLELEHVRAEAERARLDAEVQRLRAVTLENEKQQLEQQARELGRHALEDQLTGLANRRRVDYELPVQLAYARERHGALSVAAVDLDHFKQVNDRYGHAAGDDVLRAVARILMDNTRSGDLLARMGGEEFLVIFVGTPLNVASDICERLRQAVERHDWQQVASSLRLTISIGLCNAVESSDVRALLERADASLYAAKRAGRNRVEVAEAA
jgi:diguanylate cyclase (GGDEF)-like protein